MTLLVRISEMEFVVCAVVLSPVTLVLSAAIQEKPAAVTFEDKAIPTVLPLQMEAVAALFMTGLGVTITLTCCTGPLHPLKIGVTLYRTV